MPLRVVSPFALRVTTGVELDLSDDVVVLVAGVDFGAGAAFTFCEAGLSFLGEDLGSSVGFPVARERRFAAPDGRESARASRR